MILACAVLFCGLPRSELNSSVKEALCSQTKMDPKCHLQPGRRRSRRLAARFHSLIRRLGRIIHTLEIVPSLCLRLRFYSSAIIRSLSKTLPPPPQGFFQWFFSLFNRSRLIQASSFVSLFYCEARKQVWNPVMAHPSQRRVCCVSLLFSRVFNLIRHRWGGITYAETQFQLSRMISLFLHLPPDQIVTPANVAGVVGVLPPLEH